MKKYIKIAIVFILIFFVGWFVWQRYGHKEKTQEVDHYVVSRTNVVETVSASGELSPVIYANLSFAVPALVKQVNGDVGDQVKKGQKLIILDRNSILAEIQVAQIDVQKAQATERLARRKWDDYKPEEKERIKKDVEQARARLFGAQSQLSKTEIVSPIDGVITQKNIRVGEVAQGMVMRVIDDRTMDIEVLMSETDAAKLHKGQEAFATFDAYNNERFPVNIINIDPEATKVQDVTYYKTTFTVPDTGNKKIFPGMSVDVDVVVNQRENVLAVPLRFVRKDESGTYVYVLSDTGDYQKKYIVTGVEGDDGDVEIVSGIDEGMVIYAVREDDLESK